MSENLENQQHALHVENGSGYVVRTQINTALEALAKNNSGVSAPVWGATVGGVAPTAPAINQFWADTSTTPAVLKIYDGSTWHQVRSIEEYDNNPKSRGVYTHTGDLFKITGTGALQLPSGGSGSRPGGPLEGMIRWNNASNSVEVYTGSTWTDVSTASISANSINTIHIADGAVTPAKLSASAHKSDYRIWYSIGSAALNYRTTSWWRYGPLDESTDVGLPDAQGLNATGHWQSWWSDLVSDNIKGPIGVGNRYCSGMVYKAPNPLLTRSGDVFMKGYVNTTYGYGATYFPRGSSRGAAGNLLFARASLRREQGITNLATGLAPANANYIFAHGLTDINYAKDNTAPGRDLYFEGQTASSSTPNVHHTDSWYQNWSFTNERIVECAYFRYGWHFITNNGVLYYSGDDNWGGSGYGTQNGSNHRAAARPVKLWEIDPSNPSQSIAVQPKDYPRFNFVTNSRISDGTGEANNSWYGTSTVYGKVSQFAIDEYGSLWTVGNNDYGQLGNGTTTSSYKWLKTPFPASDNVAITYVHSTGGTRASVFAIDSQHRLWVWGYNATGQLGDGTTGDKNTPYCISQDSNNPLFNKKIVHVMSMGYSDYAHNGAAEADHGHTYFLTDEGFVYACGFSEDYGRYTGCHSSTASRNITFPELVTNTYQNGSSVTVGGTGMNDAPGDSSGSNTYFGDTPRRVIQLFAFGGRYTCVYAVTKCWSTVSPEFIDTDPSTPLNGPNVVFSWGNNTSGQLGRSTPNVPNATSLRDFTPTPIEFRDYGITSLQEASNVTSYENEGTNQSTWTNTNNNNTTPLTRARFIQNIRTITSNQSYKNSAQGTTVIVTESGHVYYAGHDAGDIAPGVMPDADIGVEYSTGTTGTCDRFTPINSLPEPCYEWQWMQTSTSNPAHYVFTGFSGMSYYTGTENDYYSYAGFTGANFTGYTYMEPMFNFVSHS
tara:strand:+ start:788 stop:3622 length:2835 start_codon:yes stop_codon:yes gene_type:complete